MIVEIDKKSGFCFGVVKAITKAENELTDSETLYCLGDIVHNGEEVSRLANQGMVTISREEFFTMQNCRVLIRAHGEPPETYEYARQNNIELVDATCPIVLQLQNKIRASFELQQQQNGQVVIFGKPGHAEVIGLNGQTGNQALIISSLDEVDKIDFTRPISLYSQTTKPLNEFRMLAELVKLRAGDKVPVEIRDTVCRQVSNRGPHLQEFAKRHDVIIFVAGRKSSNGQALFGEVSAINPNSHFVASPLDLNTNWFRDASSIGICGATSTPMWLMEQVAEGIQKAI
jgi:4-hydroxy-3-methylbut-2-enyl diphosphate reductase